MQTRVHLSLLLAAGLCGCAAMPADHAGGGAWGTGGKADEFSLEITVPAGTEAAPGEASLGTRQTTARTRVRVAGTTGGAALQLHARSEIYRRASFVGASPTLVLPVDGGHHDYALVLRNHGAEPVTVEVVATVEPEPREGAQVTFNAPDCDGACGDDRPILSGTGASNGLRESLVDAVQGARVSLDFAIFGLEDRNIQDALCNAAKDGVRLRVVTDWRSLDPADSRGYYAALAHLGQCIRPAGRHVDPAAPLTEAEFADRGIQFVKNNAIMHHKFFLIDRGTEHELLVTGSANQTTTGIEKNHNHMVFLRGASGLADAYAAEFEQLFSHCRNNRDRRGHACAECTATCTVNVSPEGPWELADPQLGELRMSVHFSPSLENDPADDALRVLRGPVATRRVWISKRGLSHCVLLDSGPFGARRSDQIACFTAASSSTEDQAAARASADARKAELEGAPDPACMGPGASCFCMRASSGKWSCDYCGGASGDDWGLMGDPDRRVLASLFAATDMCFGLAFGRAAAKGVETLAVFDRVSASGEYARDDAVCAMGVETYVDDWAGRSAIVFNHNKLIVVDDVVFDGSMNISASGLEKNNENTVVYRGAGIADVFAEYIHAEAALLRRRGIRRRMQNMCADEPVSAICAAMDREIGELESRGEGEDVGRIDRLRSGLGRCRAEADAWSSRCDAWNADPEAYVAAELPAVRESGLFDAPKALRDCECNDRTDQGGDGLVDQDVAHCGEAWCFDGDDDDGDGLIDAIDPDCQAAGE